MPDAGNPGACLMCVYGYYPKNYQCLKVSPFCEGHNVQTGDCLTCQNTNLIVQGGKCRDPNCQTYDQDTCVNCKQNFSFDPVAQLCKYSDPNCEK